MGVASLLSSVGDRIMALRETRGLKRQQLADELGISRSALEMLEKNDSEPRAGTLLALSQYFNVSIDYILTGTTAENRGYYIELGLTDEALAFWEMQIDLADNAGKLREFSAGLSGLMSTHEFYNLVWGLLRLNPELAELDKRMTDIKGKKPKTLQKSKNKAAALDAAALFAEMLQDNDLVPLTERRDLLKLRYLKQVERFFERFIIDAGKE